MEESFFEIERRNSGFKKTRRNIVICERLLEKDLYQLLLVFGLPLFYRHFQAWKRLPQPTVEEHNSYEKEDTKVGSNAVNGIQ